MSNKFGEMSLESFCDYVSANPGGARKAFELRKKAGGDCGGGKERVVKVPVERVVEKVIKVGGKEKDMGWVKYPCIALVMLGVMGMMFSGGEVIVKEVPVEVVKDQELVRQVKMLENRLSQREVDYQMVLDIKDMDSRELQRQIKLLERQIDRGNY